MNSIFNDMRRMHDKYGVHAAIDKMDKHTLEKFLWFRLSCIEEELTETQEALFNKDPAEIVDGLIDIIVFAAGTLDLFDVDGEEAWFQVLKANMTKEVGIKEGRPNPMGLPDLMKPEGWKGPDHEENTGKLKGLPRVQV